jgi:hypothetical protein
MKDRVDKSMGIVILIPEDLAEIKLTETLRFVKCESRKERNCSDSSGNSPDKILDSHGRKTDGRSHYCLNLFFMK